MTEYRQRLYARRFPDKASARIAVATEVASGRIPPARSMPCIDCKDVAREYDHYEGYDRAHWLDVEPVCRSCHWAREKARRTHCHRGHEYTDQDWRTFKDRPAKRFCRACAELYGKPGFVPVYPGTARKGLTPHGSKHHAAKLDEDKVREIRSLPYANERVLAKRFGVSPSVIHCARVGKTWRHVA